MRSVYAIAKEIAELAPRGGDTWQNVGMRQVPVRLLTELREAVKREQRVKVAWQAAEIPPGNGIVSEWPPFPEAGEFIAAVREWRETDNVSKPLDQSLPRPWEYVREHFEGVEFAGAWRFDA